jgi:hypothetical protein
MMKVTYVIHQIKREGFSVYRRFKREGFSVYKRLILKMNRTCHLMKQYLLKSFTVLSALSYGNQEWSGWRW